jgi:glutamate carboxypeptidase
MTTTDPIEAYLGASQEDIAARVLERVRRYVAYETPSHHAHALNALAAVIADELRELGASVELIDAPGSGSNIIARFAGATPSNKPLVLLAHMDTVHELGTLAARPFRTDGERAWGPGIYDMKSGVALLIEALTWHTQRGTRIESPVTLLITCDEEVGSHSVRSLIAELASEAKAVLVPEPCLSGGGVKTQRKGVATYTVRTTGRASHAGGDAATAVSAITELLQQCAHIQSFADLSKGTSINIGTISGGTATNVVAADAEAGVDVRLADESEAQRIHSAMLSLKAIHPEAELQVTLSESRPPLVRNDAVLGVYEVARRCAAELGFDLKEGASGGGSDGSLAAATGAAVLDGLGPDGGGAHAVDEHILVRDLPSRLALLCRLLEEL